jgi:hypothetical protein
MTVQTSPFSYIYLCVTSKVNIYKMLNFVGAVL